MDMHDMQMVAEANKKRHENRLKEQAYFAYNQAQLVMYAFNKPEAMPKIEEIFPFTNEIKQQHIKHIEQAKTQEEIEAIKEIERDQLIMLQNAKAIKETLNRRKGE